MNGITTGIVRTTTDGSWLNYDHLPPSVLSFSAETNHSLPDVLILNTAMTLSIAFTDTVLDPPTVTFFAPGQVSNVTMSTPVSADAWTVLWMPRTWPELEGPITFQVHSFDAAGNEGTSGTLDPNILFDAKPTFLRSITLESRSELSLLVFFPTFDAATRLIPPGLAWGTL